jgi:hypothetical protein
MYAYLQVQSPTKGKDELGGGGCKESVRDASVSQARLGCGLDTDAYILMNNKALWENVA